MSTLSPWAASARPDIACMGIASAAHQARVGRDVHVAVDDHTCLAYVEVLPDQRGPACRAFLERAITWYRARGITCARVLSDNGSGYRSRVFREACAAMALRHRRTRPYTPRTNGKAERFIQTLLREWVELR